MAALVSDPRSPRMNSPICPCNLRPLLPSLALAAAVWLFAPTGAETAAAADRDCSDLVNQAAAQDYFVSRGGPEQDPDRLDSDGDGVACESLPCPCSEANAAPRDDKAKRTIPARITRVVDGDTIEARAVRGRKRRYTVRLIGIDTPEVYGGRECGGRQASRRMKRLALKRGRGRRVVMTTDPTQDTYDRYDRLLAYVRVRRGPQLNIAQVRAGWAMVYVYDDKPFAQHRKFKRAQRRARVNGRGVWSRCDGEFHRRL
jgi:endonuclease YncB( thermonuclease family)